MNTIAGPTKLNASMKKMILYPTNIDTPEVQR